MNMAPYDIVAYSYKADTYCPDCVLREVLEDHGLGEFNHIYLSEVAERLGIDDQDERSYDSDDFPKVVFRDQLSEDEFEYCCECHTKLI